MKAMGGSLGKFLYVEEDFEFKVDKWVVKILVEMDLREGLPKEMEIV
jgi:hypothetical protein